MIGGGGEKLTLRVAAELADWWNLSGGSFDRYSRKLEVLRGHCDAVGRDYDSIVKSWSCECVAVADTREEADRMARRSPFYEPDGMFCGTPDDVAEQLRPWIDAGVTHLQLRFADFPSTGSLRLFAREVIPRLSD